MNWTRVLLGGVAAGVVAWLADFVLHGMVMADTYTRYPEVFTQTATDPLRFLAVELAVGLTVALLFAKTRASWPVGWKGGATFGFFFGLAIFFMNFFSPLVLEGFPYYLSWCWGGIGMIDAVVAGTALGAIVK